MLFFGKRRIIKPLLKLTYEDATRAKWWLKDESLVPAAQSIAETVRHIANHSLGPSTEFFKLTDRKAVFRVKPPDGSGRSLVAKAFLLPRLEHRLRYHKYGLDEAANLVKAADRGINTPRVCGYGHLYGLFRLVEADVVITEELLGFSPIRDLLVKGTDDERHQIFMRTVRLFVSLYNAGCNHIDVNSSAVMLSEGSPNGEVFLLDFQHARFHDKPNGEILMFEASTLLKSCRSMLSNETIEHWLDELLSAVGIREAHDRQRMRSYFDYYLHTSLSRKKCRQIR